MPPYNEALPSPQHNKYLQANSAGSANLKLGLPIFSTYYPVLSGGCWQEMVRKHKLIPG